MIKLKKLCGLIEEIAPLERAFEWDNSGLILSMHEDVGVILVCLDVTEEVVQQAKDAGADTIISHHPIVFTHVKRFAAEFSDTSPLIAAAIAGINVYSAHTSYDCAEKGMNRVLADKLGLKNVIVQENGLAVGELDEAVSSTVFGEHIKAELDAAAVRYNAVDAPIRRVACMGGSASDFVEQAAELGAQAYVTGEAKHHHFLAADRLGVSLYEAGHYDTEIVFVEAVKSSLQNKLDELQYNVRVLAAQAKRPYVGV